MTAPTPPTLRIGSIVGSLASRSLNASLADAVVQLAPEGVDFVSITIGRLPLHNRDLDATPPASVVEFREAIAAVDGLMIVTPEYNRSIPAALKNALDWASRPRGAHVLGGKPVGIIGGTPGALGTALAQQHLRNILAHLDMPTLGQPEAFVQVRPGLIAADGTVTNDATRAFLRTWVSALVAHVEDNSPGRGRLAS